jgi:hypothetical protein
MKVLKTGADKFRVTATPAEASIVVNCMKETFRQGRAEGIPSREYETRIGASLEEVKAIVSMIEAALLR